MKYNFKISSHHHKQLIKHLYPGDGKEAVAILLCGRLTHNDEQYLLVHKVIEIPHELCSIRRKDLITWPTNILTPHLQETVKKDFAVVKIHSHPTGFEDFSMTDDDSDRELFDSIYGWMENNNPHGSLIMLPDTSIFGRIILPSLDFTKINKISIIGDDIAIINQESNLQYHEDFNLRTIQAFGEGTVSVLKKMKIAVVGCSGTGSPTIEQLVRLGVGEIILIDPDKMELKNINRIINSSINDAKNNKYKVDVLEQAINKIGISTKVKAMNQNLFDNEDVIKEVASCDLIFGCVDSVDGRNILNAISTFYIIPLIDIGIKLIADGKGGIVQICGTINYIRPHGSSLLTRGVYNSEDLRAASLYRANRAYYFEQKKEGYIKNINVESPAVISINMLASSTAVNEMLARIHCFRFDPNSNFAITRFSLTDGYFLFEADGEPDKYLSKNVGRGDLKPLLNMPELEF